MNKTELKLRAAEALIDAADFLKRRNRWCTNRYSSADRWNSEQLIIKADRKAILPGAKFCAVGALAIFSKKSMKVLRAAKDAMMLVPNVSEYDDVEAFNDTQKTKGPVMRAMRLAARKLMSDLENV